MDYNFALLYLMEHSELTQEDIEERDRVWAEAERDLAESEDFYTGDYEREEDWPLPDEDGFLF